MKKLILIGLLAGLSSLGASENNEALQCYFTDLFLRVELKLDSGRLTKIEYDWNDSDPTSEYLYTVLNDNSRVTIAPIGKLISIQARDQAGLLIDARLDYKSKGENSQETFPFSVVFHDKSKGALKGACDLSKLRSYDNDLVEETKLKFVANSSAAIALCMNRAVSDWTIKASEYNSSITNFYALYRGQSVPGVAADVSQSFSPAEREVLGKHLVGIKTPPTNSTNTAATRASMWSYCMDYAGFLRTRFEL